MEKEITAVQKLIDTLIEFCVQYSFQVIGAVIILILGFMAAGHVSRIVFELLHQKKKLDITLSKFIAAVARIIVLAFAVLIALGNFGITIAPFIAALSALAFGASFALQLPLSNYGAGLSIILTRPFVVGDTITVAGVSGVVEEVKMAATVIRDEDGVRITIPNKEIVGQILWNSKSYKIVESSVGISYNDDPEKAIQVVLQTIQKFPEVNKDPGPQVGLGEFADSSINIAYRYWVPTQKYFQTVYAINLALHKAITQAGLSIPYPQRDLHIVSQTTGKIAE